MDRPISKLADLKEVLQDLRPLKPGYKRVYRGQSNNFSKMLSNACRPNATKKGLLWKLALSNLPQISELYKNSYQSGIEMIMNYSVWFEAFIQQYGPGSPYLDVTSSIDVALWFALNQVEITSQKFWMSEPGHPKIPMCFPTMHFSPKVEGSAWFYVMDVPIWDEKNIPKHGELVDILKGPKLVSKSIRIQRQQGNLVYGDIQVNEGDLSMYYACDPIEILSTFTGFELAKTSYAYLFPNPNDDPWLHQLSKAPLVPHLDDDDGFSYRQSLEVYIVTKGKQLDPYQEQINLQMAEISLPIRAILRLQPDMLKEINASSSFDIEDATYIQVAAPLLSPTPPIHLWNQTVLQFGLAERARPKLVNDHRKLPFATLKNVILEFSPLDTAFYRKGPEDEPVTAIWLTIEGNSYHCVYFFRYQNGFSFKTFALTFTYSDVNGRFEFKGKNNVPVIELDVFRSSVKYFFIALHILRKLSPTLKPDSFCSMTIGSKAMIPIRGQTVTLLGSAKDPMDMRLHFLMDSKTDGMYLGPAMDHDATSILSILRADKFPSMKSIRELYGHTDNMSYPQFGLPERQTDGFDAQISDYVSSVISQLQHNSSILINIKNK